MYLQLKIYRWGWMMAGGLIFLFSACKAKDKKAATKSGPGTFYYDYRVTAAEGQDKLTVLLHFRDERDGDAFSIEEWGAVTLDGEKMPADSSRLSGIFYELHKPIDSFTGNHRLVFSKTDTEPFTVEFDFQPLRLLTAFPDTIKREDLLLDFSGLDSVELIRVLITDTSFISDGINQVDTVRNGRLRIPAASMESLANGPVQLELIRESERRLRNTPGKGGRLLITYSLKREGILQD